MLVNNYIKLIFFILLVNILNSCSNVKEIYIHKVRDIAFTNNATKILNKNEAIIIFKNGFNKDLISINGFERKLTTIPQLSFAGGEIVSILENTIIIHNNIKIILNSNKLKKFKVIYINYDKRKNKKYIVEYTNEARPMY